MTYIVSFQNQKGGVGKSSTALNVASQLATKNKVLFIDLDPQGNSSKTLTGQKEFPFEDTIAAMFDRPKTHKLNDLIKPAKIGGGEIISNLDIVVADMQLSRVIETSLSKINRERILEKQLHDVDGYDYVILDCPPNLSLTSLNAIQASDATIIVVDSGSFAIDGIVPLLDATDEIKEDEANVYFLRNKVDSRNKVMNDHIDEELSAVQDMVLPLTIRQAQAVEHANKNRMPVKFFNKGALVNNDYSKLASKIREWGEVK